jgi:hypothetical protein
LSNSNTHKPFVKPWVYHLLFWAGYYLFAALICLTINQIYDPRFYWQLLTLLPPDMLLVYANLYLLTRLGLAATRPSPSRGRTGRKYTGGLVSDRQYSTIRRKGCPSSIQAPAIIHTRPIFVPCS